LGAPYGIERLRRWCILEDLFGVAERHEELQLRVGCQQGSRFCPRPGTLPDRPLKIRVVPGQPHCFAYGGFDIQMHRTLDVLRAQGVDARPLDFWSRDGDFEILHLWGFDAGAHMTTARFARAYGKKIVLTPLVQCLTPLARLRHAGAWLRGEARQRIALARLVDRFLAVNEQQGETLSQLYGVPAGHIEIVPTMIEDRFFEAAPASAALPDGFADYFICTGNICARKNQQRLAAAAIATGTPILFAGDVPGGEESYARDFARAIAPYPFLRWNRWMDWEELLTAYRASRGVVLPSFEEQQPTVGLEAAALGKPLLLGKRPYARQKFYAGAYLADPDSLDDIARGLRALETSPGLHTPPVAEVQACRGDRVGRQLQAIFAGLLAG
jgi:glycosyltransferase involved in cell wall biosynthesis